MDEIKFKVGDRVQGINGDTVRGVVEEVHVIVLFKGEDGWIQSRNQDNLEYAKLSPEEAWIECALLVGRLAFEANSPLYESERTEIRHQCYRLLGGAGIKVDEPVKARVRGFIEKVEARG